MQKTKARQIAFLAVLFGAVIMFIGLFLPPVIGSADNGELVAVIEGNGLYKLDHGEQDEYFQYASVKYGVSQYYVEAKPIVSSRNLWIQMAKGLNFLFAKDKTIFDIRFYAILLCLYTLASLYLLVEYVAQKFPKGGLFIAISAVLIFCDSSYLTWLCSFYEESVIYPSLLMMIACTLQLSEQYHKKEPLLALFLLSALLLVTVNNKTIRWGTISAGFCLLLLYGQKKRQWFPPRCTKLLLASTALFFMAGLFFQMENGKLGRIDEYHSMTRGTMIVSENPEETADFFGIDRSYSLLEKSSGYEKYPAIDIYNELLEENFYQKYNTRKIVLYYISHASTFGKIMQYVVNQAYTIHGNTGGNYDRTAGKEPGAKTEFFQLYSQTKEKIVPKTLGFLLIVFVLFWILNWKEWWNQRVFLYLMLMSVVLMMVIAIRSGASEVARQLFFYNVSFDVLTFFIISHSFHWLLGRRKRKRKK